MRKSVIAAAAVAGLATAASADTIAFDINVSALDSGVIANIDFDLGAVESIKNISVEMSGTFMSDLIIVLTAPDLVAYTALDGATGGSSDLGVVAGDSSLANVDKYLFVGSGGSAIVDDGFVEGGAYNAVSWGAGPHAAGTWNLYIEDDFSFDPHSVGRVVIEYNLVPAPGSAALLGLAGIAATRRRRR